MVACRGEKGFLIEGSVPHRGVMCALSPRWAKGLLIYRDTAIG